MRSSEIVDRLTVRRAELVDLALAVFIASAGAIELAQGGLEPAWAWVGAVAVTGALTFALRRRQPVLLVAWLVLLHATLQGGPDAEPAFYYLLALVVAFSVTAHARTSAGLVGLAAVVTSYAVYTVRIAMPDTGAWDVVFGCAFLVIAGGLGFGFGRSSRRAEELRTRAVRLVSQREAEARAAVAEERRRIARELHDAVAHDVSVITLQLGAVRRRLEDGNPREAGILRGLERSGREAVEELRRLVGILREDSANGDRSPRPTMSQLGALIEQVRGTGTQVSFSVDGDTGTLPPGIDVSAYRIIQEALSNVLRHAPGARAAVSVTRGPDELRLDITDDGPGPQTAGAAGRRPGGHGILGIEERVRLFGGEVSTGPEPGGGFGVHARFPLADRRV